MHFILAKVDLKAHNSVDLSKFCCHPFSLIKHFVLSLIVTLLGYLLASGGCPSIC